MNRRYCNGMVHVIKPGDTLYQLSRYYRIPMARPPGNDLYAGAKRRTIAGHRSCR